MEDLRVSENGFKVSSVRQTVSPESEARRKVPRPPMLALRRTESVSFHPATESSKIDEEVSRGNMWSVATRRGRRRSDREDMYTSLPFVEESFENEPISVFAIFDGHGGQRVARYASTRLPYLFLQAYEKSGELQSALQHAFLTTDEEVISSSLQPALDEEQIRHPIFKRECSGSSLGCTALRNCYLENPADSIVRKLPGLQINGNNCVETSRSRVLGGRTVSGTSGMTQKTSHDEYRTRRPYSVADELLSSVSFMSTNGCGTTATVVVLVGSTCCIAHVGDSRAVLSRAGGLAIRLFEDHRPGRQDEMNRIESAGGLVVQTSGAFRVNGVLAVSRAIGDVNMKDFVISQPETTDLSLTGDEEFMIVASDGLWDFVSDKESVDMIRDIVLRKPENDDCDEQAAKLLVQTAWDRGSNDDVSVMVLNLARYAQIRKTKQEDSRRGDDVIHNVGEGVGKLLPIAAEENGVRLEMITPMSAPAETPRVTRESPW